MDLLFINLERQLLIAFLLSLCLTLSGQNQDYLELKITFSDEVLELNKPYFSHQLQDSLSFTKVKLYLSTSGNGVPPAPTLIDLEKEKPQRLLLSSKSSSELNLSIGVDSLTNMSGAQGGDLDPLLGMYWTWNSGYINVKIEGHSPALSTRKGEFKLHLGGFLHPNQSYQEITLPLDNQLNPKLVLDLESFLSQLNLHKTPTIMSPSATASELSLLFAESFKLINEK